MFSQYVLKDPLKPRWFQWLKEKISIPPYVLTTWREWIFHGDVITILLFEEFLNGIEIKVVAQRPKTLVIN